MIKNKKLLYVLCFFALLVTVAGFSGCQKESLSTTAGNSFSINGDADIQEAAKGVITLELQPGEDGQDTYVTALDGTPAVADGNYNASPEMAIDTWTVNDNVVKQRSFLKFTGLSVIPANAEIIYAGLLLSGVSSSVNLAVGNSVYPGSPYLANFPHNSCYVQLVEADWDEETITWNNQPAASVENEAKIPGSTSQWNQKASVDVTLLVKAITSQQKNYGFRMIQTTERIYRSRLFAVSEDPDALKRPKLTVKYKLR